MGIAVVRTARAPQKLCFTCCGVDPAALLSLEQAPRRNTIPVHPASPIDCCAGVTARGVRTIWTGGASNNVLCTSPGGP